MEAEKEKSSSGGRNYVPKCYSGEGSSSHVTRSSEQIWLLGMPRDILSSNGKFPNALNIQQYLHGRRNRFPRGTNIDKIICCPRLPGREDNTITTASCMEERGCSNTDSYCVVHAIKQDSWFNSRNPVIYLMQATERICN